ncbi:ZP3 protein-like [Arapaima gigas]
MGCETTGATSPSYAAFFSRGCPVTGLDASAKVLIFESQLQDCSSTLTMTDVLIYTFTLVYMPRAVDGNDQVCSCCETNCGLSSGGFAADYEGEVAVGPINIKTPNRLP